MIEVVFRPAVTQSRRSKRRERKVLSCKRCEAWLYGSDLFWEEYANIETLGKEIQIFFEARPAKAIR